MANETGKNWGKQTLKNIKWAVKNGGGSSMAPFAALLGIPMQQRRGGQWMTIDPARQSIYPMGATPYYGPSAAGNGNGNENNNGGGNPTQPDPNAPPPLPGDKFTKNLIPEWWKDWYRTQGQYGGVPPVEGLL